MGKSRWSWKKSVCFVLKQIILHLVAQKGRAEQDGNGKLLTGQEQIDFEEQGICESPRIEFQMINYIIEI